MNMEQGWEQVGCSKFQDVSEGDRSLYELFAMRAGLRVCPGVTVYPSTALSGCWLWEVSRGMPETRRAWEMRRCGGGWPRAGRVGRHASPSGGGPWILPGPCRPLPRASGRD